MSTWRLPRFLLWLADQTGEPEQVSPKERQFGTIRKRKNGLFQALYFDLAGKRHTAGMFKTKTAARAALNAIQTDLLRGSWRDPTAGEIKFSIYAESWMNWKATDAAPRTLDQYRSLLRCHLLPAFGTAAIRRITTPMVRDWNAALAKEKAGTARCAYRLLRAILNAALEDGLVPANPCKVKGAGSDRSPERVPPTVAKVQALMRAMPPHLHAAVMVAAHVPIRRNEVLGLKRQDVNLTLGTLTVERQLDECPGQPLGFRPTKNKERGTVGLSEEVVAAWPITSTATWARSQVLRCSPIATVGMSGRAHCGATGIGHGAQSGRPRTTSMTFGTSPEPCFPRAGESCGDQEARALEVRCHGPALPARHRGSGCVPRPSHGAIRADP